MRVLAVCRCFQFRQSVHDRRLISPPSYRQLNTSAAHHKKSLAVLPAAHLMSL